MAALVLRESWRSFSANKQLETAATLAFYGFLSLMPLLLLAVFLLGLVLDSSEQALAGLRSATASLFPAFNEDILNDLMRLAGQRAWGVVNLALLIWSMTPFAGAMRHSMELIFKSERRLHFFKAKLLDMAAVLTLLVLFLALVALRVYGGFPGAGIGVLRNAAQATGCFGAMFFIYTVFSPPGVRLGHKLLGAAAATALLLVIRPLFGLLLHFNPNFGYAFGSLKAIFLLLVWVYYTFAVLLFGAEIMANARRRESLVLRALFAGGPMSGSRLVERFVRHLAPGETLFHEGDAGASMYYVTAGTVDLRKGARLLKTAQAGDYFGELSMLLQAPRTASALAGPDGARLVAVTQENFDTLLRENPEIVQAILKEMALRLKTTSERIVTGP